MTTLAIKTHESDEPSSNSGDVSCAVCQRQIARYTCPTCNLLYCSLNCFRSELHGRCSETFYRKEFEIGIRTESSGAERDRNKMNELLKRIEDQSAADEDGLFHFSDEENGEDSFVHRFSAIDISSASADELLRLLTKEERNKFFVALEDPSSELVRELLESTELGKTTQLPWWKAPSDCGQSLLSLRVPNGLKPNMMVVPTNLINQASLGISLLYNICAVLLAYAYVTRHLSISPLASTTNNSQDRHEARRILSRSVTFLIDRKSKLRHMSLTDAVVSFWSRLGPGGIDSKAMLTLLEDIEKLVRPRRITIAEGLPAEQEKAVGLATDHPSATTIMAISDISALFGGYMDFSTAASQRNHIVMKLTFYAAHILSTPCPRLHALADEINLFSKNIVKEAS